MKRTTSRKLSLSSETIRNLDTTALRAIVGGAGVIHGPPVTTTNSLILSRCQPTTSIAAPGTPGIDPVTVEA